MSSIRTRKAYEDYYKKINLVEADYLWENGKSTDISTMEEGKKIMAPGTFKGKPIFEDGVLEPLGQPSYKTPLRKGGTMIVRSKNKYTKNTYCHSVFNKHVREKFYSIIF